MKVTTYSKEIIPMRHYKKEFKPEAVKPVIERRQLELEASCRISGSGHYVQE